MEISGADWLVVFEAYFDESGTDRHSPLVCVAGYLFSKAAVAEFCTKWRGVLLPLLPLGAEIFRAADCVARRGKFSGISIEQSNHIMEAIVEITKQTITIGAVVAIERATYESTIGQEPAFRESIGSPYSLCAMRCAQYMAGWLDDQQLSGDIAYMFEGGYEYAGEAAHFFSRIEKHPELKRRYRLSAYSFMTKTEAPPLQAADLLAWEWQRAWRTNQWRPTLKSLCERPHFGEHISETGMGIMAMVNDFYGLQTNRLGS